MADHTRRHGPLPHLSLDQLIEITRSARLLGRGGAGFPVHRKLAAAQRGARHVVVANAAEGEPASAKDRTLLATCPQLVLDGLSLLSRAVRAERTVLYAHEGRGYDLAASAVAARAVALGRDDGLEVVAAPARFVSGEESALASRVGGGPALPTSDVVWEHGVRGRPTLVQNVETLAHIALVARYGSAWFAGVGDPDGPGSMLHTVSVAGAANLTVVEAPTGVPYADVLRAAGVTVTPAAVLIGGYHGAWLPAEALAGPGTRAALARYDVTPGAGVAVVLPAGHCALRFTAGVLDYLAGETAGQCGPCVNGLPALSAAATRMVAGDRVAADRVAALVELVEGRGGCHHPDGTARLVRSTLTLFLADVAAHKRGRCTASGATR